MAPKRRKAKAKARESPKPLPRTTGKILQAFQSVDINNDGTISRDELAALLTVLDPGLTMDRVNLLFCAADVDGDEKVNFAEFIDFLFSDFQEAEAQLSTIVGAVADSSCLKKDDPDVDEDFLCLPGMTLEFQYDNALESAMAAFPDLSEAVAQCLQDAKTRLTSQEFEERMVGKFGVRLDKDGNGTLSFEELKDLIQETLQADKDLWEMSSPSDAALKYFFDSYNTALFGKEMGSQEFLNLMRGLNMHLTASLLPEYAKRWRMSCEKRLTSEEQICREFSSEAAGELGATGMSEAAGALGGIRVVSSEDLGIRNFNAVDTHADAATKKAESSMKSLASYLCNESSPCRDDIDKARAIFRWVTKNVRYDMDGLLGRKPKQSNAPEDVLKNRTSVCAGYAGLFLSLATAAGLKCMKLSGACKGAGFKQGAPYSSTHAWNAVHVEGQWALLDACWGAGSSNGVDDWSFSFKPAWFMPPPSFFSLRHFPEPGNERWQLLEPPYTYDQYMAIAAPTADAFMWGMQAVTHPEACVTADADGRLSMIFSSISELKLSANVEGGKCLCDRDMEGNSRVRIAATQGNKKLTIFGKPVDSLGSLTDCFAYQLSSGSTCSSGVPSSHADWGHVGHSLIEPLEGNLTPEKTQHFAIAGKGLAEFNIILKSSRTWLPMAQQADGTWAADVKMPTDGDVVIVARPETAPKSGTFASLLTYKVMSTESAGG